MIVFNKKTRQNWLLLAYVMLIIMMLCLRDIAGYSINKLIFAAFVIMTSVLSSYKTLLSLILFTLPLMGGLPGNYFLPIWAVLILYHQALNRTLNPMAIIFSLIFSLWELIWCAFLPFSISGANLISYCSVLFIFSLLISEINDAVDYRRPILSFCLGSCVMLFIIFAICFSDPSLLFAETGARMGGDEYVKDGQMVLFANANTIGYFSVATIATLLTMLYYKKVKILYCLMLLIPALLLGMYSISRTWFILVVLSFVLYFIFQKVNRKTGYLIFALFLLIITLFIYSNENVLEAFLRRFTGDDIETGGGRTVLFAAYNDYMFKHPVNFFLGTGSLLYREVIGIYESTHNSLQQIWISYGLLGFILFLFSFISMLRKYYVKGQKLCLLPMLVVILFLQTIQLLNPHNGLYPLIVAFIIVKMINNDKQKGLLFTPNN